MSIILEASAISVRVGPRLLLDDVNLTFGPGQAIALIGPNGAGKSTLLRVLAGEIMPHSGHVALKGQTLATYSPQLLAMHRAVLSQQVTMTFPFTVADVVGMGVRRDRESEQLIGAVLAELDLYDLAHRAITTLSGGEQQRTHFARVLVQLAEGQQRGGCGILLLDEPTASLDLRHQLGMVEAVTRRVKQGALVIAVFHDLNLASLFAQRIVVLNRGTIDCDGAPEQTITGPMLERVFSVETAMNDTPATARPFVLPQLMTALKPQSTTRNLAI
jgi:iron complex transport system ATP-binding protein